MVVNGLTEVKKCNCWLSKSKGQSPRVSGPSNRMRFNQITNVVKRRYRPLAVLQYYF